MGRMARSVARCSRRVAGLLAVVGVALASGYASAQSAALPPQAKPPFPAISLPDRAQGERAIAQLADRLPEVAAWYGMSVPQFAAMLRLDRTVWLDRQGRVFFEEELRLPAEAPVTPAAADPLSPALEPLDQTFKLHSRPSAKRTIYLNFVGATLTNTAWNSSSQPTITAEPFDLDGAPSTFSNAELERIQYIWKRVAEAYSAFDVDVTTEPPPADRLTRSSTSDDTFGTTVLITRRTFYSCSCGGVAYLSSFDDVGDYYKPALVFFDALGSGNEKYVADAIAHEAGHNLSLSHDGTASSGYYQGHGSGATGWAPIMGVGYYQQLVQWSKGEYAGANNTEDDYARMQLTGLPLRADDHGNAITSATPLPSVTAGGVTTITGSGVIERPTDVDVFSFVAGAGPVSITVSPAPRAPMLDILATLRDSNNNVLATANPADSLPATLTATLSATGTYFVTVDGVGKGDPLSTGYTDYGSIGQYTISGTVQASAQQPPLAVITATPTSGVAPLTVNFSSAGSADADGSIVSYAWNFGDGGTQVGVTTAQRTYNSPGTYTASLTVTDDSGLTDTESVTITVQEPAVPVTLTVSKSGSGTVTSNPTGINCGSTCSASYASGTSVTLTAAAAAGSTFAGWSGACTGTGTCTVSMTQARTVTASFTTNYALTVSKSGTGGGTVTSSPAGISCGSACSASFVSGTVVTLTAAAATGSTFAGWSGACTGTGSCVVSMSQALTVTATFNTTPDTTPDPFGFAAQTGVATGATVTSNTITPSGYNTAAAISVSNGQYSIGCSGTFTSTAGTINPGQSVCVRHTASASASTTVTTTLTIGGVSGSFSSTTAAPSSYTLTVGRSGTGSGTVSSSPAGISCGSTCSADFAAGSSVTLTAAAATGSTFAGWSGACTGTGSCVVSMSQALTVTATFNTTPDTTPDPFGFAAQTGVATGATVTSNTITPSGYNTAAAISVSNGQYSIGCSGTFTSTAGTINPGQSVCVRHTASASASTTVTTTLTIGGVSGSFSSTTAAPSSYTLTVGRSGTGSGTVSSSPAGISCGSTCSADFAAGSSVTLTAAAATGSTFAGWSGACTGTGSCVVSMSQALTVTATFEPTNDSTPDPFGFAPQVDVPMRTVVTSEPITPTGFNMAAPVVVTGGQYSINCTGSFTSRSGTINPGQSICVRHTSSRSAGTTVTTTLSIGGVSGSFSSTTVPPPSYTLSASNAGTGNGAVASADGGIDCGSRCSASYVSGTSVTLTASAAPGSTFAGWSGACSRTGTCTVSMSQARSVTATFNRTPDTAPDAFGFAPQSGVATGAVVTSEAVTPSGFEAAAPISVAGGLYSVGCTGTFTSRAGTISPGQSVCVRQTASASGGTTVTTTLTIGGVSGKFESTTAGQP